MSYKTKSLLYFVCFVLSAFTYYGVDSYENNEKKFSTVSIVEVTNDQLVPDSLIELEDLN
ncbi:MAG: hypothetical protein JSV59_09095 [Flavobacteriaceae bacterium]|nr:MAG: hypothetical protein JSV59_09095 [Flavobacteriaceae bacterium]